MGHSQEGPCGSFTHRQQTSRFSEGEVLAFINALQAAPAVQTLHTAAVLKNLLQCGLEASVTACRRGIKFLEGQEHGRPDACGSAGASCSVGRLPRLCQDPHLLLACTAAPLPSGGADAWLPSGVSQFLDGLFNPNRTGAELAVLAKSASKSLQASIMVATNGRMALSGLDVTKQPQQKVFMRDSDILTMFAELDVNQNGYIDKSEFLRAFDRMGLPANTEYLRDVLKQADKSSSTEQRLSFDAYKKHVHACTERCWKAFNQLDVDQSGYITEDNLLCALKQMGMKPKPEDARRMIQLLDANCDHYVTFQEFCRFACMLPRIQLDVNAASVWADSTDFAAGIDFRPDMKPDWMAWKRSISGGAAGAMAKTLVAPLERMRTLAMASPAGMGLVKAFSTAWADGGALGLFKGNMATIIKAVPGTATQFSVYHGLKDHLNGCREKACVDREQNILVHMVAGAVAGAVECTVTHPLETVRTLLAMPSGQTKTHSIMGGLQQAWKNGGVGGLYAGYRAALAGDVLGAALGFTIFEQGKKVFETVFKRSPDSLETGIVGMGSSALTLFVVLPFDVVQRRMQVAGHGETYKSFQYKNIGHALTQIIRTEGVRALYRGSVASFIKIPMSMGLSYGLYDAVNKLVAAEGIRMYSHKRELECSKNGFGELMPLSKPLSSTDS